MLSKMNFHIALTVLISTIGITCGTPHPTKRVAEMCDELLSLVSQGELQADGRSERLLEICTAFKRLEQSEQETQSLLPREPVGLTGLDSANRRYLKRRTAERFDGLCGVILYEEPFFSGGNETFIVDEKSSGKYFRVTRSNPFFRGRNFRSFRTVGNCCWRLYERRKPVLRTYQSGFEEDYRYLRKNFAFKKIAC